MHRLSFVLRRLLQIVPALLAISVVTFLMIHLAPGDPARTIAGPRATEETLVRVRAELGLDKPLWVQYGLYLGRLVRGDLGENLQGSATVSQIIGSALEVTAWLIVGALFFTLLISVPLAVLAARRPDGVVDSLVRVFTVGGLALPAFWVGLMLISFIALPTGWFPVGGWQPGLAGQVRSIFLPSLTLGISMAPILVRSLRSSLIEVRRADYVKAAQAMGVRGAALTRRFVVRNALVPAVPVVGIVLGFLIGGTVLIESTFALPGLGQALVNAAINRDGNVVQGITLVLGVSVVLIYLLADIALSLVDPRVKMQ